MLAVSDDRVLRSAGAPGDEHREYGGVVEGVLQFDVVREDEDEDEDVVEMVDENIRRV